VAQVELKDVEISVDALGAHVSMPGACGDGDVHPLDCDEPEIEQRHSGLPWGWRWRRRQRPRRWWSQRRPSSKSSRTWHGDHPTEI
jgi:hypothetical protein